MSQELLLGIETSCDETAAAVVGDCGSGIARIKSNIIYSQRSEHTEYGGVVPEIAARVHIDTLFPVIEQALANANLSMADLSAIAATCGPGLIGGVIVGSLAAKTLAFINKKPFIAINHLAAHAQVCRLSDPIEFPYLLLLISGGHCQFLEVFDIDKYKLIGSTLDDSAGEVFDKIARILQITGGGAALEKLALDGDPLRFHFSIPLKDRDTCDMSFSGLKTAFRLLIQRLQPLSWQDKRDVAACLQKSIANALVDKTQKAFLMASQEIQQAKVLVVSGGVAANHIIRLDIASLCEKYGFTPFFPPLSLCTDNAVMVAWLGLEKFKRGDISDLAFPPRPKWSLSW
ncbi:MAG: tRNA (adenosine(37)-N6)-threonylcarbamoyltransferase complex transferase subunit TsaD [Holosporales bacterium]|nr:tRNA (adenosine(37)-N6)-threonylcarbamoyltransferase complex transferase subunit TsaD [Holosporales bacterium]